MVDKGSGVGGLGVARRSRTALGLSPAPGPPVKGVITPACLRRGQV